MTVRELGLDEYADLLETHETEEVFNDGGLAIIKAASGTEKLIVVESATESRIVAIAL